LIGLLCTTADDGGTRIRGKTGGEEGRMGVVCEEGKGENGESYNDGAILQRDL
jgi:hypothetical protein